MPLVEPEPISPPQPPTIILRHESTWKPVGLILELAPPPPEP